jgi:hypothetical protein
MSKPLELTVYEIDRTEPSMVVVDGFWAYRPYEPAKRLREAELTSEYWCEYSGYVREASNVLHCQERYMAAAGESFQESLRKVTILNRFATHKHYDGDAA